MNNRQLLNLLTHEEWLACQAGKEIARRSLWMQRARHHIADGCNDAAKTCIGAARDANHAYIRHAVDLRRQKDLEAQRREDYRNTLRQY